MLPATETSAQPVTKRRAGRVTIVEEHRASTPTSQEVDASDGLGTVHAPGGAVFGRAALGRLVAVCGVCGGAGASTLSYLLARFEQRTFGGEEVLVADTGGPGGGIAALVGAQAAQSLPEIAEQMQAGLPVGLPLADGRNGLRVLATGPRFHSCAVAAGGVVMVLEQARVRYPVMVIDCGTLARDSDQIAFTAASHAIWLLPASARGVDRARWALDAVTLHPDACEILAARHQPDAKAPVRQLKRLAGDRGAPLVLLPVLPELDNDRKVTEALETWQVPLQAIHGQLHRATRKGGRL